MAGLPHLTQHRAVAAIPCLNTERFIADVVSRAKRYVDQVIVIDDGSHDGTAERAKAAGAIVINHRTNQGYGRAIRSCLEAARASGAEALVILDGDGQHDPDEIPRLLAPVLDGEADLVIGSRFLGVKGNMPRYRKFGIKIITLLFNLGSRTKVSDAQSGFRAYSKKLLETLSLSKRGMSISIETLEEIRRSGAIIKEVPISCLYTSSAINPKAISHGLGVAFSVVSIRLGHSLSAKKRKKWASLEYRS